MTKAPMPMPPRPQRPQENGPTPRGHNLPPGGLHTEFADEAARAAQRYYDQVNQIADLTRELDEWRRRALTAESEIQRLENAVHDQEQRYQRHREELQDERDGYKNRLVQLVAQFHVAGEVILKAMDTANAIAPSTATKINLTALAHEIEGEVRTEDPLPRVVTAGPKSHDDAAG